MPRGGPDTTPPLSETQRKNPCPRRDPRPKTTVFLPDAGGNPERLRVFSSHDRRTKPERRRPASRHGGGKGVGCGHSICPPCCVLCCRVMSMEQRMGGLPV